MGSRVTPEVTTYVVKSGDTLRTIADAHQTTVAELLKDNPELAEGPKRDHYGNKIYSGDKIKIFQRQFCGQERGNAIVGCEAVARSGTQVQVGVGHIGPDGHKYLLGATAGDSQGAQVYGGLTLAQPEGEDPDALPPPPTLGWRIGIRFSLGK